MPVLNFYQMPYSDLYSLQHFAQNMEFTHFQSQLCWNIFLWLKSIKISNLWSNNSENEWKCSL